jgi:regulator of ribosome biosynthesis
MDVSEPLNELNAKYEAVKPVKGVPLEFELPFLSALDINPLPAITPENLKELAREGTQLLINELFSLPTQRVEDGIFATLPARPNTLPRAKPVPRVKSSTRWEKFAATKGIQKKKKVRVAFDDATGEYRPLFGYKNQGKSTADLTDWIKEVPKNIDATTDMYEAERDEKKKRVDKNAMQQRRNEEEAHATIKGKQFDAFKKMQNAPNPKKENLIKKIVETKISTYFQLI